MKPATLTIALFVALLCAVSVLCTLGASASVKFYTTDAPGGERAMGLIVVLFFMLIGWAALLLAAILSASAGSLSWLAPSSALAGVIACAAVLVFAIAAGACFVAWAEPASSSHFPRPVVLGSAILSTTVVPAALAILFTLSAFMAADTLGPRAFRTGAIAISIFSMLGCATGIDIIARALRQRAASERAMIAERRATEEQYEALRAMPAHERALLAFTDYSPDSPLWTIAGFLIDDMGDARPETDTELHRVVLERAALLPDLEAQLKSLCSVNDTRLRACGVEFLRVSENRSDARADCLIAAIDQLISEIDAKPSMEAYYPGFDLGSEAARAARTAALFPQPIVAAALDRLRHAVAAAPDSAHKRTAELALNASTAAPGKAAP